ncbi:retrotransposon protein, putative, ty1-copia subclass [Tanacetum coccineum]
MTTSVVNNSVFRSFFEKQKLSGPNFIDWYRQLIVLSIEDKLDYLEKPIPPVHVPSEDGQQVAPEALAAHAAWVKRIKEIARLMLMTMELKIQRNLENLSAYKMLQELKTLFAQQADYIDNLEGLGHPVSLNLGVSIILISWRKEFDSFVQNYNMHSMQKTINELHAMLKLHEQTLPKNNAPELHAIRAGKRKNKLVYAPMPKNPPPPKREDPAKESICHQCGDIGHWKRNCPQYLAELLKNKKLSQGASSSVSRLYEDGFINRFVNNTIQVSRNNMVYFSAIPRDGIFEIDLSNSYANESSIYTVSNKRAKLDLESALLWHYHLGHISKKRIKKLQHDGLLNSTDLRAFEKCVPCMSGKMARKPYTHQVERAKDLLGLIHTDVCGPFKIMSRQGASYFVTFIDDFSRYGYVYLLKHKHEVFETFKVFQKEVENQLGKTIKLLRSDRGGEYMSQEFLDHLKDHGIIAHHTPPYTPQHNGVSERRNRTLLDMVRSMMSQTTLPKSFWDYALETAARILNMVPTKKVEKTPYEVWHGQAPKLSYLKVWGCEALVKRDTLTKPDKLEPRSIKCIFIGYPKETMGYSFYYPPENKVLVARNAEFLENSLINQEASGSLEDLEIIQEEDTHPSIDTSLNHEEDDLEIMEIVYDKSQIGIKSQVVMSADSVVTYTSVHSEARSWSIPSEDPYEEAARQLLEQAPRSPEYVPDPMELEDHVPVYIPEPEHPEDLVPAEDEAPTPLLPPFFLSPHIRPLSPRALATEMRDPRADIPEADTPLEETTTYYSQTMEWGGECSAVLALEARVTVLETEVHRHEWQRQATDDLAVQHIMRTQAWRLGELR